jgi:uncharacterized protein (TIGR00730 family)
MIIKKVCIFGSYKDLNKETKEETVRLGKMLAEMGITVMSGGFGGAMEDISRGAKSAGGKTVGVTCYPWGKEGPKANGFVDEEVIAADFSERISIMLRDADAFVVFPGGTGTLLELSAALESVNKGLMEPKAIIIFGDFWAPVISCLKNEPVFNKKMKQSGFLCCAELVTFVGTVEECVEKLKNNNY